MTEKWVEICRKATGHKYRHEIGIKRVSSQSGMILSSEMEYECDICRTRFWEDIKVTWLGEKLALTEEEVKYLKSRE